jgi:hypothetical protein
MFMTYKTSFKSGRVNITVWENKGKSIDEKEETTYLTFTLERNYKDEKDNWQSTNSFNSADLQHVRTLIETVLQQEVKVRGKTTE